MCAHSQGSVSNLLNDINNKPNNTDNLIIFLLIFNIFTIISGCGLYYKLIYKHSSYNKVKIYSSDDETQQLNN